MLSPAHSTTLSSKGQVVLPKSVRDAKRWKVGTRLLAVETAEGVLLKAQAPARAGASRVEDLAGLLKHRSTRRSEADWQADLARDLRKQQPRR